MQIRYGNTDDAKMISELGAKTFADTFAKDNTPEDMALYLKQSFSVKIQANELSDPQALFIIMEDEARPVGYAKLNLDHDHNGQSNPKTLEIERIYSIKELIGKGVGKELMNACISEAKQRGCESVWLGVWEKNPRAIAFYKKWGFREVDTRTFHLGNDPQRDYIMELRLL